MTKRVRILCVEDVYTDAQLIKMELEKAKMHFEFIVVDNKASYIEALDQYVPDVILCDHTLPSFNSLEALTILKQRERILPFILITGSMTEDVADAVIKKGADDYIMKDRLRRLPLSVMNALEKHEYEQEKKKLFWKILESEEKTNKDLADLSSKLTLATRAAKLAVWEYYHQENIIIADNFMNEVIGCDVTQYTKSLQEWFSLVHPDDLKILYEALNECQKSCGDFSLEYRMVLPNHSIIHVWVKGIIEAGPDGKPYRAVGTTQNITESKAREFKSRENYIRYSSIWENTMEAVILGTPEGLVLAANPAACALLGRSEADLCAIGRKGILVQDEALKQKLQERKKTGLVSGELTFVRADGSTFIGEITSTVYEDASGRKRSITIVRDITSRKQLQEEILSQRNRYTELFNHAPSAIGYMSGPDHLFEMVNRFYTESCGGRQLVGKTVRQAFPELEDHPVHEILRNVYTTGIPYRSEQMLFSIEQPETREKVNFYLDFVYLPNRDENGSVCGIYFFANNITEQVSLRAELAEREKNYKNLFDQSPLPKFVVSKTDFSILDANNVAAAIYGYEAEQLASLNFKDLFSGNIPPSTLEVFEKVKATRQSLSVLVEHLYKSGAKAMVELTIADFNYRGLESFLIVTNDITDRINLQKSLTDVMVSAQRKITRAQIKGQEKEKEFIGKELHDNINQQLCTVQLLLNVAKSEPSTYPEILPKCETVVQSAIQDIRTLCRSLVLPSMKDVGLQASILELLEIYRQSSTYTIEDDVDETIDSLDLDLQIAIYRILQELFTNITKYASPKKVVVKASVVEDKFTMRVEDDGKGFDTRIKRKGIGLSNMKNRVELFGGKLKFKSSIGAGCKTEITIPLPAADRMMDHNSTVSILVAEDDIFDQELIKTAIYSVDGSCEVKFVPNGKEAITYLRDLPDDKLPSLIVLDYNMPLMNGLETLRQLKQIPRIENIPKVVYSTSFHKAHEMECLQADASAYIKKGITDEEIKKDLIKMIKKAVTNKN